MGHHATIGTRLTSAPRVRVTERVTGSAQVRKFHENAGQVITFPAIPGITHDTTTNDEFRAMLAGRIVSRFTETMSHFRKETATRWVCPLRSIGGKIVVRKSNTKEFTGWIAMFCEPGKNTGTVIAAVAKGTSINHNGEREDCCRTALNVVTLIARTAGY